MRVIIEPTILNRLLKLGVNNINIRKSERDGYLDVILQIDENDSQGKQRYVSIVYSFPYIECSEQFDVFVHCNELYTSTQFCDKNHKKICIEKFDGDLRISSNPDDEEYISIIKVEFKDKKWFNSDKILEIAKTHETGEFFKKEVSACHVNSIIKNDKNVSKLRYIYDGTDLYPISCSEGGMVAYHTKSPKILNVMLDSFDVQIEIDKHLLKKIFQPIGKKKYTISFIEGNEDSQRSFKMRSIDENTNEELQVLIF